MPNLQALSKNTHSGKHWRRPVDYFFTDMNVIAPLVVQELPKAMLSLPIAFVPRAQSYRPVAVQGLLPDKNLFVAKDGRWLAGYTPAAYRSYPFALANTEDGQQVLCVDEDSGLVGTEGEAFFNEDGTLSQAVSEVLNFLTEVGNNRSATQRLCDLLQKHSLIQPWQIKVQGDKGEQAIEGLFRIDEAALNQLPTEAFMELRDSGALVLAYCQLLSMQHLPLLGQLAQLHAEADQKAALQTDGEISLEFMKNETISFGNLQ